MQILSWWQRLRNRRAFEQQMDDELRFHLESRTHDLIQAGDSPQEAARQARIEFGGLDGYKESCRESVGLRLIDDLRNDVRFALRSLRKHALLSITVVATLTAGIGISAGVFNMIDGALFRARDVTDPASFAAVYSAYPEDAKHPGRWPGASTLQDYLAFRDGTRSLQTLAGYALVRSALELDNPARVDVLLVTCSFFQVYQLEHAKLGRLLQTEDCSTAQPVIVLSENLWRRRFAADPEIVGKAVYFSGQKVTVVGVVAAPFNGPWGGSIAWLPHTITPSQNSLFLIGRLKPGFSRADAAAELNILSRQQDQLRPGVTSSVSVTDGSLYQNPANREVMPWIFGLNMGLLGLITLLACANVTALLLSRAHARQQEIAIRLSLGAGRARLIRML